MSERDVPRNVDELIAMIDERLRRLTLDWSTSPTPLLFLYDHRGDILIGVGDNQAAALPVGDDLQMLIAKSAEPLGVKWVDQPGPPFNARGELLVGSGPAAQALLAAGADGQVLMADSTTPLGLRWVDCDCGGGGGGGGMGAMMFAVVNESTVVSNDDAATMTAAVARQVAEDIAPAWGVLGAGVTFYPGGFGDIPDGSIPVRIQDVTDQPGAAGYHTIFEDGSAAAFVFAKTITDGGGGVLTAGMGFATYCVAQVLSHEVCETLIDPSVQELADDLAGHAWIVEVGDVAALFGYLIDGVQMSDFGLPSWWEANADPAGPFSFVDAIPGPFSLATGSYCFRYDTSGGGTINGMETPAEILVADPGAMPVDDYIAAMLTTSIVRSRRARGLPDPRIRPVRGRDRDWQPGS